MSTDDINRAHYDEIEFDDDLGLLDGKPFTGIIYASYENGQLEIEFNYVDGLPSGLQRRWYPSGQLEEEWEAIRGRGSAWSRKWYSNGFIRCERENKENLPVRIIQWSADGQLVNDTDFS